MLVQYDPKKAAANLSVGLGGAGEVLVVVYTERDGDYRLISARRPTRKERKSYEG